MTFHTIDVFGLYLSPIAIILVGAWLAVTLVRRGLSRLGLGATIWHPGLFDVGLYLILASCIVLVIGFLPR
jgi:protein AaeX